MALARWQGDILRQGFGAPDFNRGKRWTARSAMPDSLKRCGPGEPAFPLNPAVWPVALPGGEVPGSRTALPQVVRRSGGFTTSSKGPHLCSEVAYGFEEAAEVAERAASRAQLRVDTGSASDLNRRSF